MGALVRRLPLLPHILHQSVWVEQFPVLHHEPITDSLTERRLVTDCATEFRMCTRQSSWNPDVLLDAFSHGLVCYIKDALDTHYTLSSLDGIIDRAIMVNVQVQVEGWLKGISIQRVFSLKKGHVPVTLHQLLGEG